VKWTASIFSFKNRSYYGTLKVMQKATTKQSGRINLAATGTTAKIGELSAEIRGMDGNRTFITRLWIALAVADSGIAGITVNSIRGRD
jgi:hypothetical protein